MAYILYLSSPRSLSILYNTMMLKYLSLLLFILGKCRRPYARPPDTQSDFISEPQNPESRQKTENLEEQLGAFGASHGLASLGRGPCANAIALATTPLHPCKGSNRSLKQTHLQFKVQIQLKFSFGWPMKKAIRFFFQVLPSVHQNEHKDFVDKTLGEVKDCLT